LKAPVGKGILSRMFDVFGTPSTACRRLPAFNGATSIDLPPPLTQRSPSRDLRNGIKAIDVLVRSSAAARAACSAGAGVGKTVLLTECHHKHDRAPKGVSIFCGMANDVGRRGTYRDMRRQEWLPNMVMVFGQMKRTARQPVPRGSRGTDHGRVFPDDEHRDVLFLVDNISASSRPAWRCPACWAKCRRVWVSAHHGHRAVGVGGAHREYEYRRHSSIQAVYVPADDLTDPAAVTHVLTPVHVDVLSRKRRVRAFPGYRPLQSSSKMALRNRRQGALSPGPGDSPDTRAVRGPERHHLHARFGQLAPEDRNVVALRPAVGALPHPAFFATERFSGIKGKLVSLRTLSRCRAILRDEMQRLSGKRLVYDRGDDEAKDKF